MHYFNTGQFQAVDILDTRCKKSPLQGHVLIAFLSSSVGVCFGPLDNYGRGTGWRHIRLYGNETDYIFNTNSCHNDW